VRCCTAAQSTFKCAYTLAPLGVGKGDARAAIFGFRVSLNARVKVITGNIVRAVHDTFYTRGVVLFTVENKVSAMWQYSNTLTQIRRGCDGARLHPTAG
jgi:hypothetical protein